MFQIELFALNGSAVILRYFLLMSLALVAGFSGQWWIAFFCLPVFISALMGLKISSKKPQRAVVNKPSVTVLQLKPRHKKAS